jgi:hypothetical protein
MKTLAFMLVLAMSLVLLGCNIVCGGGGRVVVKSSRQRPSGNLLPPGMCLFLYEDSLLRVWEIRDSCHLYKIGDMIK